MVDDWVIKTMYATKRRRKNPKSIKTLGCGARHDQNVKSNPSKRHRERLNSELEHLASLLPFEQNVIVKLDKLSILRLAVSYLRMKSYFQAISHERLLTENRLVSHLYHCPFDLTRTEGEACLQALNGFIFIMSCDGEVFSVSRTVERYLGFHQADILHQSALELIHSEDREEFRRQLSWRLNLPSELQSYSIQNLMTSELCHHLRRRFTVRFRCLLDNTSGFITLELSGCLQFLYGQQKGKSASCTNIASGKPPTSSRTPSNGPTNMSMGIGSAQSHLPPLGLFVVCSPLGPLPSIHGVQRDMTFKTKHRLDLKMMTIDSHARMVFNYTDTELQNFKVYDIIHPEDLQYVARGHGQVFRSGAIGLLVHRWLNKSGDWIWLQSRLKLMMKNGVQDHLIAIHRQLSYQEGMELLIHRSDEFKLPFPLLEPETLLNEDGYTGTGRSIDEQTGVLSAAQLKQLETNFLGSIIHGNSSSSGRLPKVGCLDEIDSDSPKCKPWRSVSGTGSSRSTNNEPQSFINFKLDDVNDGISPRQHSSPTPRQRLPAKSTLNRRKKCTAKERSNQTKIPQNETPYSHLPVSASFQSPIMSYSGDYSYGTPNHPSFMSNDLAMFSRSLKNSPFDHSTGPFENLSHQQTPSYWHRSETYDKLDFPQQNSELEHTRPGMLINNYTNNQPPYNAYAMAAVAMVAAANSCHTNQSHFPLQHPADQHSNIGSPFTSQKDELISNHVGKANNQLIDTTHRTSESMPPIYHRDDMAQHELDRCEEQMSYNMRQSLNDKSSSFKSTHFADLSKRNFDIQCLFNVNPMCGRSVFEVSRNDNAYPIHSMPLNTVLDNTNASPQNHSFFNEHSTPVNHDTCSSADEVPDCWNKLHLLSSETNCVNQNVTDMGLEKSEMRDQRSTSSPYSASSSQSTSSNDSVQSDDRNNIHSNQMVFPSLGSPMHIHKWPGMPPEIEADRPFPYLQSSTANMHKFHFDSPDIQHCRTEPHDLLQKNSGTSPNLLVTDTFHTRQEIETKSVLYRESILGPS